jgi:hypothetical protein
MKAHDKFSKIAATIEANAATYKTIAAVVRGLTILKASFESNGSYGIVRHRYDDARFALIYRKMELECLARGQAW